MKNAFPFHYLSPIPTTCRCAAICMAMIFSIPTAIAQCAAEAGEESVALPEPNAKTVAYTQYAIALHREMVGGEPEENLVFSPWSLAYILGMLSGMADGDTAAEIRTVLHADTSPERYAEFLNRIGRNALDPTPPFIVEAEEDPRKPLLRLSNSLWLQGDDYVFFMGDHRRLLEKSFFSEINYFEPGESPAEATEQINEWVKDRSAGMIDSLIDPSLIDETLRFTVLNTVSFRGLWSRTFDEENTEAEDFYLADGSAIKVRMMNEKDLFAARFHEGEHFKAISLFYQPETVAMLLILPTRRDGLAELEQSLTPGILLDLTTRTNIVMVDVKIPKFRIAYSASLRPVLEKLGMKKAFSPTDADFSNIIKPDKEKPFLPWVIHKTAIGIDEQGTEIAGGSGAFGFFGGEKNEFVADHPFLFAIYETKTGGILFMGRVTRPENAEE